MGPTAAGKTSVALELADEFPFDIISVDASQVYRRMNIGTAKPPPHILKKYPHRLIDVCDPWQPYSAGRFRAEALCEIHQIIAGGRIPLLVGGTMFYFHALEHGLSRLPSASSQIRSELNRKAESMDWPKLHAQLASVDPAAAEKISPNDSQRIQRLLELHYLEGRPLNELVESNPANGIPFEICKIVICQQDRAQLKTIIAERFEQMLKHGLLQEAEDLYRSPQFDESLPAMRSVGYKQAWQYFSGTVDYDAMKESAIQATCVIAKRQLTWIRNSSQMIWSVSTNSKSADQVRRLVYAVLSA